MNLHAVPDTPPRAVLYLRQSVSRDDSISIELQEMAGRDYCAKMGYVVTLVEADQGLSGRKWDNRPAVIRVMDLIESKQADVVVLWKWSRLSRSRRDWALASDRVDVAGGRIESATEPIDTGTASGRFARGVMTEYAAFQSEQIGEQWEEVRQRRIRLGLPASGRLPWGWDRVDGRIEPNPVHGPIIVQMYEKYLAGQGSAAISRWMNGQGIPSPNGGLWSRDRPFTVLDSPIHAGLIPYRGEAHQGAHTGLIDGQTWAMYQAMRAVRREGHSKPRQSTYILSSLIRCHCGLRMSGKGAVTGGIWYGGYICTSMAKDHGPNYISAKRIDPVVHRWLAGLESELDSRVDVAAQIENDTGRAQLQREFTALQKQITNLTRQLAAEIVPEAAYRDARAEIEERQAEITAAISVIDRRRALQPIVSNAFVRGLVEGWELMPADLRSDGLRAVLAEVVLTPGEWASVVFTTLWGDSSVMSV